jgi:methoxymalonate biosynthesis acyl carrier protein
MYQEEIRTKVREFISQFIRAHEFKNDDDIFALGFVNSLFAMQLVLFVENEFGLTVENDDLDLDNFRSVNAISGLVERKSAVLV